MREFKSNGLLIPAFLAALIILGGGIDAVHGDQGDESNVTKKTIGLESRLTVEAASSFSRLALGCIQKEFPNKPSHVINDDTDIHPPRILHPAFHGCFDWHSAVHGHWMLVRLLELFPELPEGPEIRAALDHNLSAENITAEAAYFEQPNRKSFERTYGWAWLLKLAEELHDWDDPDARRWSANLSPLTGVIVDRYLDFLPRQTYPIRTGVHPNTAFGIAFALDFARATNHSKLEELLIARSRDYYENDTDYPALWEPGGEDFFSACLLEADLMRRVMDPQEFAVWFTRFLPQLKSHEPASLLRPAIVADRTDPKIVHLDGLNLSRAWCMLGIASALPAGTASQRILLESASLHADDALAHIASGHYEGEHWLASFAVYMLSTSGNTK